MVTPRGGRVRCTVLVLVLALTGACGDDDGDDVEADADGVATSDNPADDDDGTPTDASDGPDDTGEDPDEQAGIDPCSLLTVEEVEAAVGATTEPKYEETMSTDFQDVCSWTTTEAVAGVQVLVNPGGPGSDFEGQRLSADDMVGPAVDVEVAGADRAYAAAEGSIIGMEVGDAFVQVSNLGHGGEEVVLPLAELVAGRL